MHAPLNLFTDLGQWMLKVLFKIDGISEGELVHSADEGFEAGCFKCHVEDGVGERGVGGVPVPLPIICRRIEFEIAGVGGSIDFNGDVGEVRAGSEVPFAELDDAQLTSVLEPEIPPK